MWSNAVGFGSFGEFVQGSLPDHGEFLVSCPFQFGATIKLYISPAYSLRITGLKPYQKKLAMALRLAVSAWAPSPHWHIHVTHRSDLEVAKGLGSSTADIVAAFRALAPHFDHTPTPEEIAKLACVIEPTDTVIDRQLVAMERGTGRLLHRFDWWPRFHLVGVVPSARFQTSPQMPEHTHTEKREFQAHLTSLIRSSVVRDPRPWAEAATRSAEINQRHRPNPWVEPLKQQMSRFGALGAVVAHTGTVAGLLFEDSTAGNLSANEAATVLTRYWEGSVRIVRTQIPCPIPL